MFGFSKKTTSQSVKDRYEEFHEIFNDPIIDRQKLENLCFQGIPENRELKAKCWKLLLGYLPLNTNEWHQHLQHQRNLYEFYINLLFQNPETYNNGNEDTKTDLSQNSKKNIHYRSTTANITSSQTPKVIKSTFKSKTKYLNINDDVPLCSLQNATSTPPSFKPQIPSALHYFQGDSKHKKPLSLFFESDEDTHAKDSLFEDASDEDPKDCLFEDGTKPTDNLQIARNLTVTEHEKRIAEELTILNIETAISAVSTVSALSTTELGHIPEKAEEPLVVHCSNHHSVDEVEIIGDSDEESQFEASVIIHDSRRNSILVAREYGEEADDDDDDDEEIIVFTPGSQSTKTSLSYRTRNMSLLKDIDPEIGEIPIDSENDAMKEEKEKENKIHKRNLTFGKVERTVDPLNTLPNNPWETYFGDWDIWNRIEKDIHRTHQTYAFFRSDHMIPANTASNKYRFPFDIIQKPVSVSSTPTLSSMTFQTPHKSQSMQRSNNIIPPSPQSDRFQGHIIRNMSTEISSPSIPEKKSTRMSSLVKENPDDEIADIESVDSDSDYEHRSNLLNSNLIPARHVIMKSNSTPSDLKPPKHKLKVADPNQKARIERYAMDSKQHGIHAQIMIRILCVYARLNKGVQYVQGMNELLAPIYYVFTCDTSEHNIYAEADSFFCFMNLMSHLSDRFIPEADNSQVGILATVGEFDQLLKRVDPQLWHHLSAQDLDTRFYSLRWLLLLMAMEFQLPEVLRLWDSFISDHRRFEFVTYFAVSMMLHVRPQLMSGGFAHNLQLLQKFPAPDLYELLVPAIELRDKYPITECDVYNYSIMNNPGSASKNGTLDRIAKQKKSSRRSNTLSFNFRKTNKKKKRQKPKSPNMNVLFRNTKIGINKRVSIFRARTPTLNRLGVSNVKNKSLTKVRKTHKDRAFSSSSFTFFALKKKFMSGNVRGSGQEITPAIVVNIVSEKGVSVDNDLEVNRSAGGTI